MTAAELRNVFASSEFQKELEELSAYLASILQERPIVHLLAKHLWRKGLKFELEYKQTDLVVGEKRVEFKMHYDREQQDLTKELSRFEDSLSAMWAAAEAKTLTMGWRVGPKVYKDVCKKRPHIFVWIILSRDLSKVPEPDLQRIGFGTEQRKYNKAQLNCPKGDSLIVIDRFLGLLQKERSFSLLKLDVETNADFPSTYHFRICEFPESC